MPPAAHGFGCSRLLQGWNSARISTTCTSFSLDAWQPTHCDAPGLQVQIDHGGNENACEARTRLTQILVK